MRIRDPHKHRHQRFEPLEQRQMLALTIITPDEALTFPAWVYDMGTAIVARDGVYDQRDANGDGIVDIIQNSRINLTGTVTPVGAAQAARDLVLYDWMIGSDTPGTADQMAGDLVDWIVERLETTPMQEMHFIGHGRGALVNMQALRQLAAHPLAGRIGFVQMTTLDPYARGDDGVIEFNPGGLVDFADNYYQDINPQQLERGAPLLGALNFRLNDQLSVWNGRSGALADHHEVHDWYHWTIDSTTLAADEPVFADASLPTPTLEDREWLYDSYEADLDNNDSLDYFAGGASIGYYFTVAGGGIGTYDGGYTIDLARRTMPLYLGSYLNNQPWDTLQGIAYAPNGDLYAMIDAATQTGATDGLYRIQLRFDAQNNPVPQRTLVAAYTWFDFRLPFEFRSDGRLIAAAPGGNLQTLERWDLIEIDPESGTSFPVYEAQSVNAPYPFAFAVDHADNIYLSTTLGLSSYDLVRVNSAFTEDEVLPTPAPKIPLGALTVVNGLLYGFSSEETLYSRNLVTGQLQDRGALIPPFEGPNFSPDMLTSVHSLRQPRWHNRGLGPDVDGNGRVNSSDCLALINTLLLDGARAPGATELFGYHYDVTNDGRINTSDLLAVINRILEDAAAPSAAAAADPATVDLATVDLATGEPLIAPASPRRSSIDGLAFALAIAAAEEDASEEML